MGAYLSQPKTEKVSTDEVNEFLLVGASSMQGWRNSQEDAHNSILNFDKNTSFFAVYDGHGGAEVATYCADKLPNFLKELESYKKDQLEEALKAAFLGFDKTLLEPEVVEVLKILAGEKNLAEADDSDILDDDEDDEDLAELREEGNLPLNEVLEKYKGGSSMPVLKKIKDGEPRPSGSKPQSPFLRGRRAAAVAADAANKAEINEEEAKTASTSTAARTAETKTLKAVENKMETDELEDDSTVSSSSSGTRKTNNTASSVGTEAAEAEATELRKTATNGSTNANVIPSDSSALPDSSHLREGEQNGNVTSSESKACKTSADVSTSSSSTTSAKVKTSEDAVSGSNDSAASKQNGMANAEATSSSAVKTSHNIDRSGISSTSKDAAKEKLLIEDDSTDDDADFDAHDTSSSDEADALHALEYSSEDDAAEDDEDEDDDDDDEEGEEEEADEDEDEESAIANEQFCANMIEEPGKDSGCTAVVALLRGRDLYVANAGDSRCVVCRNGKAIEMSLDHKPEDDEESARILKAGGRVTLDGRVNGGLNLSRAIGDHAYKMNSEVTAEEQMISALPDIKKLIITPEDEFMVLACDGIWNFMSSDEVVDFVRLRLKDESKKISQICEELFDNCLAPNTMGDGTGCDNMTAVIVRFQPKLLEMPTNINPNETEDVLLAKQAAEADAADASLQKSLKRCASPTYDGSCNEAEKAKTKRMKTDDKDESNTSSSSNDATSSSNSSSNASATTSAAATTADAEQKECDSANTSTNEAAAAFTST